MKDGKKNNLWFMKKATKYSKASKQISRRKRYYSIIETLFEQKERHNNK